MESKHQLTLSACTALLAMQVACVGSIEPDAEVAEVQQEIVASNALTVNALTVNALTVNALTVNALTVNALRSETLVSNPLINDALRDPLAREVLDYAVSCALPAGTHLDVDVDGVTYEFEGELGLAPRWGHVHGSCNKRCQEWVSACVIARLNHVGEHVWISLRGDHDALGTTSEERAQYAHREATYYGNIFEVPGKYYACLSPGETQIPRVCGDSLEDCGINIVGSCDQVCRDADSDGSFPRCRDHLPDRCPGHGHGSPRFPPGTETYKGSVTVFLP